MKEKIRSIKIQIGKLTADIWELEEMAEEISSPTILEFKKDLSYIKPRDWLNDNYRGGPVSAAVVQAARKAKGDFGLRWLEKEIYKPGVEKAGRRPMQAIQSALSQSDLIERVGYGFYRYNPAGQKGLKL